MLTPSYLSRKNLGDHLCDDPTGQVFYGAQLPIVNRGAGVEVSALYIGKNVEILI